MKIKESHFDIYANLQSGVRNTQKSCRAYSTKQTKIICTKTCKKKLITTVIRKKNNVCLSTKRNTLCTVIITICELIMIISKDQQERIE